MTPPKIDPTNPKALLQALFDDDRWVKDQFAERLGEPILDLCEALAACFRLVPSLNEATNRTGTIRAAFVAGFVYGVLDDILISTKLLLTGKLPVSGNVMRQVVEGIAMSILCSTDSPAIFRQATKKKNEVRALYWERLEQDDTCTQGHLALSQLVWNARALGVSAGAVERLRLAKNHYNIFSHCGKLTIASRMALEQVGTAYVGGHFDLAKVDGYRNELEQRIGLCQVLPPFIERMLAAITPPATAPGATAQHAEPA
jgi:hypothetical protein